jgi:hypothetical protein
MTTTGQINAILYGGSAAKLQAFFHIPRSSQSVSANNIQAAIRALLGDVPSFPLFHPEMAEAARRVTSSLGPERPTVLRQ